MHLIVLSFFVAMLYGLNVIINKLVFDNGIDIITCFIISSVFWFVFAIVLLIFHSKKNILKSINKSSWLLLLSYTIIGLLAYILYLYCIKESSNINLIVAIACTSPIFTLLATKFISYSTVNMRQIIGTLLTTIGICIVILAS